MKIKQISVTNFGKLSNLNLSFDDAVNSIVQDNGWGKSTLCAFIRVMFFGLEGDAKRDEISCERKRFAPWQGGAFGGSIVFTVNGKEYKVSRFFGNRATEDTFSLLDNRTNLESNDYSEKIGEELFHLNSESFMRSVFIAQSDCANAVATDDINAKLGNISDNIDINKFAGADSALETAINALKPNAKKGEIYRLKSRASELTAEVTAGRFLEKSIEETEQRILLEQEELEKLKEEKTILNQKRIKASKMESRKHLLVEYEEKKAEYERASLKLKEAQEAFTKGIPDEESLKKLDGLYDCMNSNGAVMESNAFTEEENALFPVLSEMFFNDVPTEEMIEEKTIVARNYRTLKSNYEKLLLTDAEKEKLDRYDRIFENPKQASADVDKYIDDWTKRSEILAKSEGLEKEIGDKKYIYDEIKSKKKKAIIILIVFAVLFAIGGGAVFVFKSAIPFLQNPFYGACILWGISAVFIIVSVIKGASKQDSEMLLAEIKKLTDTYESNCEKESLILTQTKAFLTGCGFPFEEREVSRNLRTVLMDVSEYESLANKRDSSFDLARINMIKGMEEEINEFLSSYSVTVGDGEYPEKLTALKAKAERYLSLRNKCEKYTTAFKEFESSEKELKDFFDKYGFECLGDYDGTIKMIQKYDEVYRHANEDFLKAKERLDNFTSNHNMDELLSVVSSEDSISLDDVNMQQEECELREENCNRSFRTDSDTLNGLKEKYEEWNNVKNELADVKEQIERETVVYNDLLKTREFLSKAKEKLTARYMEPLYNGFSKYYRLLTGEDASEYKIDANIRITKEEQGLLRDTALLSYGYRDLIGLCLRLSMTDAMYKGEKPVLVLDDPFVNLDDKKTSSAAKLLSEVAKEYQVIYFTCKNDGNIVEA